MVYKPKQIPRNVVERLDNNYKIKKDAKAARAFNLTSYFSKVPGSSFFSHEDERRDLLNLIDNICGRTEGQPAEQRIRFGALLFARQDTPSKGSMLHEAINEEITIDDDEYPLPSPRQVYTYIKEFYDYVAKNLSENDVKGTHWKSKKDLLAAVHHRLSEVAEPVQHYVDIMSTDYPDLNLLKENYRGLIKYYRNLNNQRSELLKDIYYSTTKRLNTCDILELILDAVEIRFPFNESINDPKDPRYADNCSNEDEQKLILGTALLGALKEIADGSKTGYIGSAFFKKGMPAINQETLKGMGITEKLSYLSTVQGFLQSFRKSAHFPPFRKRWKDSNVDKYLLDIDNLRINVRCQEKKPNTSTWLLTRMLGIGVGVALAGAATVYGAPLLLAGGSAAFMFPYVYLRVINPLVESGVDSACKATGEALVNRGAKLFHGKPRTQNVDNNEPRYESEDESAVTNEFMRAVLTSPKDIFDERLLKRLREIKGVPQEKLEDELPNVVWRGAMPQMP